MRWREAPRPVVVFLRASVTLDGRIVARLGAGRLERTLDMGTK